MKWGRALGGSESSPGKVVKSGHGERARSFAKCVSLEGEKERACSSAALLKLGHVYLHSTQGWNLQTPTGAPEGR